MMTPSQSIQRLFRDTAPRVRAAPYMYSVTSPPLPDTGLSWVFSPSGGSVPGEDDRLWSWFGVTSRCVYCWCQVLCLTCALASLWVRVLVLGAGSEGRNRQGMGWVNWLYWIKMLHIVHCVGFQYVHPFCQRWRNNQEGDFLLTVSICCRYLTYTPSSTWIVRSRIVIENEFI